MTNQETLHHIDTDGTRIAYWISGPEDGPRIALIHGWTGGKYEFEPIIPELNAAGYCTFAMDMPGHRDSENVTDRAAYSMTALADTTHRAMKRIGLCPAFVLGFSMGGAIADELAIRHPDDVRGLILLGSAGFNWFDDQAQIEIDEAEPIVFDRGMEAHYDVWKQRTGKEQYDDFGPEELQERRAHWARTSPDAYVGTLYGLRDKRNTLPELIALGKPMLIIHGERDEKSISDESAAAHKVMDSSTYHIVPDAEHFAHEDNPADFLAAVQRFLEPWV